MRHRPVLSATTILCLAAALAGCGENGPTRPATARATTQGEVTTYRLSTDRSGDDGWAQARGRVDWLAPGRLRVTSTVERRCGAADDDGEGGYLWLELRYADGSVDGGRGINLNFAYGTCDGPGRTRTMAFSPGKAVTGVRLRLDESSTPSGKSSSTVRTEVVGNPRR